MIFGPARVYASQAWSGLKVSLVLQPSRLPFLHHASRPTGCRGPLLLLLLLGFAGVARAAVDDPVPELHFTVTRFEVVGDNPLSAAETETILNSYLGEFAGLDGLLAAADALEQAMATQGHAFHRVTLPPQTLEGGTVRLEVLIFKLGKITVKGNQRYSEASVRRAVPRLVAGETPSTRGLARNLALANLNPSRSIRVNLSRSEETDALDAELLVRDRRPWNIYGSFSNQGTPETGDLRLALSAEHVNLWDRDHRFAASYTMAPDKANDLFQAALSYSLPFYFSGGSMNFFYVYSDVRNVEVTQTGASLGQVNGSGEFFGAGYTQHLARRGGYEHSWSAGLQERAFSALSDGSLGDLPDTRSRPVSLQYEGRYRMERGRLAFYLGWSKNLAGGDENDDSSYDLARTGASTAWEVLRMGATVERELPRGFLGRVLSDGQFTTARLIPGEQFGLGGLNSVRGFQERALSGDLGFRSSFELWTPERRSLPGLRALAFVDMGYRDYIGQEDTNAALSLTPEWVASAGAGLRYRWGEQLSATLDYANPIERIDEGDPSDRRWYFSLLVKY